MVEARAGRIAAGTGGCNEAGAWPAFPPAAELERIIQAIRAWRMHAPDRIFWGMTLAQFEAKAKPNLDADAAIARLRIELRKL